MTQKKKDFSQVNINPVYDAIAEATEAQESPQKPRKTYSEEEAAEIMETLQTSGKKGVKLPRINLAFTPSNYEFIKIMSKARGQNLTEFVNDCLKEARENHADKYKQVLDLRNWN